MTKLLVVENGVVRNATKRETCQHWMVKSSSSCGRNRAYRCAHGCGHSEYRPMKPGESLLD